MIPHKLHIKNFLSYGPETQIIDFSNYHLICLSGKNGHGKSAMLDAITWAIWGQARKSCGNAKPDAGLLHLGQKHMMVILEFEVNGANYRVRREYLNTASKPFATLDFGIQHPDGKLTALTDKTIKDTQEKIERSIGITYESFTNSTFLRQGQSNEFSKKLPKERKEILAQILQLNQFEQQKKIALMHARKLQIDWTTQTNISARINQELISLASVQEQQQQFAEILQKIEATRQNTIIIKADLITQAQTISQKNNELLFLTRQQQEFEKQIAQLQQEITTIHTTILTQKPIIDFAKLKEEEQTLIQTVQLMQQIHQKKVQLKEQYLTIKEKLTECTTKLQQKFQLEEQVLKLNKATVQETLHLSEKQLIAEKNIQTKLRQNSASFIQQLQYLQTQLQPLANIVQEHAQTQTQFEKNKQLYQNLCAQSAHLKEQITVFAKQQIDQHHQEQNICSQCEQTVTSEQKQKMIQSLATLQKNAETEFIHIREQIQNLKVTLTEEHTHLQKLQTDCNKFILLSTKIDEQTKQYKILSDQLIEQNQKITLQETTLIELQKNITNLNIELEFLSKKIHEDLQSPKITQMQKTLQSIEQEAKIIQYQPQQHQEFERKLTNIRKILTEHQASNDSAQRETLQLQLAQLHKNLEIIQFQQREVQEKLKLFTNLEQQRHDLRLQEQQFEKNIQELEKEYQQLLVQKGTLEQQQKKQRELESEQTKLQVTIKTMYQDMIDYQEIAKALGKDGIQALLIEQAIPEIEHETNQILARLTNNQTQIFIESLRDLKKGGSKETLDIKISDSFGLRDYEMFSGGEAFRIDFALRIGISKLLARRAGTTLQTIFIDEGFGSQDEEGLQLIMDNIYKIQDDFAKIIIVSHLPEMKEQFPVQFIIEKKRSGSTVSIVHQG
ncbi:SMC family ATPase [Candidatus Babeliales bacterium]|nr:SMC family ATPase [Candidatus Babeliales bacterium]